MTIPGIGYSTITSIIAGEDLHESGACPADEREPAQRGSGQLSGQQGLRGR